MGFFEGMDQAGAQSGTTSTATQTLSEFSQKLVYTPLSTDELRAFMNFYTKTVKDIYSPNESLPRLDTMRFEIQESISTVYFYGEEAQVKKLAQYLNEYIKDRKARGNEKMERFMVKDGAGKIFALALNRTFPKAIVNSDGMSAQTITAKPTFEWTDEELQSLKSYDGKSDEVTILGSNYEVTTAKRIADDWGLLVPPLQSEIRMFPFSGLFPENMKAALLNTESPNGLRKKFPTVEIDDSFSPIVVFKGKPQDLDTLVSYLKELEDVWNQYNEKVEVINVSPAFFNLGESKQAQLITGRVITTISEQVGKNSAPFTLSTEQTKITWNHQGSGNFIVTLKNPDGTLVESIINIIGYKSDTTTLYGKKGNFYFDIVANGPYNIIVEEMTQESQSGTDGTLGAYEIVKKLQTKYEGIKVELFPSLNQVIVRYKDAEVLKNVKSEIETLDKQTETLYSMFVFFDYLSDQDIQAIWENFYKQYNVQKQYISSLNIYKVFGPEKYVQLFINELSELDTDYLIGRNKPKIEEEVLTELVRINITSLTQIELEKLLSVKIPGVKIERFDVGGYFITGTEEQILKTKDFLNTLSMDFIEDSSILYISQGIDFATIEKVLALYFKENELEILDLSNPTVKVRKFLIKGQKERTDNAKIILRSFELIENTEGIEQPYARTLDYRSISESVLSEWSIEDITQLLRANYPNVTLSFLTSSQVFLLIGKKSEVESAISEVESLPQKPIPTKRFSFTKTAYPFQNSINNKKLSAIEMLELARSKFPDVQITLFEDASRNSYFELRGKEELTTLCFDSINLAYLPVIFNEDEKTFNVQASGQKVVDITKLIANQSNPVKNIFLSAASGTVLEETCDMQLSNILWEDWLKILERLYRYTVEEFKTGENSLTILIPPGSKHETGMEKIRVLRADYGYEEALNLIKSSIFGGEGYTDPEKGFVVFTGISDSKLESLMGNLLEVVKQTPPMVEIRVIVIDDKLLDDYRTAANITLSASPLLNISTQDGISLSANLLDLANFSKILENITKNLQINLTSKNNKTNIDAMQKTSPYLSTISGKTAEIKIGNSLTWLVPTKDASGTIIGTEKVNFTPGYNLTITPSVRSDNSIQLKVEVSVSNQIPDLLTDSDYAEETRSVKTEVILRNEETLVIGGLEGQTRSVSLQKIPFLGDLPFIGKFFRNENEFSDTRSVSIFITPSIKFVEPQKPRITVEDINIQVGLGK